MFGDEFYVWFVVLKLNEVVIVFYEVVVLVDCSLIFVGGFEELDNVSWCDVELIDLLSVICFNLNYDEDDFDLGLEDIDIGLMGINI